jgi:ketosteroid isomerase-like protein
MEKLASLMSDSYVGKLPESLPNGGTFNGPNDFIQNCLGKIPTLWSDFEIEPIQMYESGNTVFMHGKITAGGKTSETMHMCVVEDGKFVKFQAFDDSATLNSVANT